MTMFHQKQLSLVILIAGCLTASVFAADEKSLADLKAETRAKLEKGGIGNGEKIEVAPLRIESKPVDGETQDFALSEGNLRVPKPLKADDPAGRGRWDLKYPGELRIVLFKKTDRQRHQFDQLPEGWGKDDLEKILYLCPLSLDDMDRAKTPAELADLVVKLTAKDTLLPPKSAGRMVKIDSPQWEGILWGDIGKSGTMGLSARVKGCPDTTLFIQFFCKEKATSEQVVDYLAKMQWIAPAEKEEGK